MEMRYTEVPGATLAAVMLACWLVTLFVGAIGAILA